MLNIFGSKANRWRDSYNPLRGLSLPRMLGMLDAGERGEYADLQWFYYYMERTDVLIFSVYQRRCAALLGCDWDVRVPSGLGAGAGGVDMGLAEEQAACLREVYDGIENFRDATAFLFSSFFRGYAHLEKHYSPAGGIFRLEPVEQWFWVRDGMFGDWEYNQTAVSGVRRGIPIRREDFVIEENVPLNRMLSVLFLRKNMSQKDWDSYLETYGIPSVFLIGPPNTSDTKAEEYQKIAEDMLSDGRGYLPAGSDIKYVNAGGGRPPFEDHMEYIDKQMVILGTGGLLTMLSESGSGTLAGSAHTDSFTAIARSDAALMSGVFQADIDAPVLAAAFPGQPVLAYFSFATDLMGADAARVINDAVALRSVGLEVSANEVGEKSGYDVKELPPPADVVAGAA